MLVETFIIALLIFAYLFASNLIMNCAYKILKIKNSRDNLFLELFYNSLVFSIICVSLVAIICTHGRTIFIISIPLMYIAYLYNSKSTIKEVKTKSLGVNKQVFIISIFSIVILTIILSYYFTLKDSIRNDVAFYTKIGECMINQGIENPFHYYNNDNDIFKGNMPYHYFELWFAGMYYKISSFMGNSLFSNYILNIYFIYNSFRVIVIIGVFGLINKYVKVNIIHFLIVFLILIVDISAYCNWWNDSYVAESNFFERPNFIFYYLFFIPIFESILNGNPIKQALWSAIFCVATITALPSVSTSLFIMLGISLFKNKDKRTLIFKIMLIYFLFTALIAIFYKFFGASKEALPVEVMTLKQMIAKTFSLWKACVFMFATLSFQIGLIFVIIFMIISSKFSKKYLFDSTFKKIVIYSGLLCITGISIFQMVPYLDNMYQFAFIGYCSVILILMIVISVKLSSLPVLKRSFGFGIFLFIIIFGIKRNLFFNHISLSEINWRVNLKTNFMLQNDFSLKYINDLELNAPLLNQRNGASIIDEKDVLSNFQGFRHSATYQLGNYLAVFNNNINLPLISDPDKLYTDEDKSNNNKDFTKAFTFNTKTLFYKFYDTSKSYKDNISLYVKQNKIKYVFASKSFNKALYFDTLSIMSVLRDSNKGHQLIILKD